MLPGTFSGMGKASALSVSLFSSTTSVVATIAWPAGIQAGDLAVLTDIGQSAGTTASVRPVGFVNLTDVGGAAGISRIVEGYRILDGSEAGNITGISSNYMSKLLRIFRGNRPILSVIPSAWSAEATSGDPVAQAVAASAAVPPVIVLGTAMGGSGGTVFSVASPAFDATASYGNVNATISGYKIYNSSPSNHSIDMNQNGSSNVLASGALAVSG